MWSGPTSWVQPPSSPLPLTTQHVGADAADVGAHLHEHAREVLDVRLAGGVADDRRARASARRPCSAFSVAMTDGSSMKTSPARRPPSGACEHDVAPVLDARAERAEGVEVRVEAAAADDVAARRRHHRAAEARQQRAGEQERGADALGELAVDLRARVDAGRAERDLVVVAPLDARRRARSRSASIASTSRMRGTLRTTTSSLVRTEAARIGRAPFLLPAGTTVPDSGTPPSMTNFSMSEGSPPSAGGSAARLG